MYKTDNRRRKNRGRYTLLGLVLGVMLTVGGLYVYDNYRQPILKDVNIVKQIAVDDIQKSQPDITPITIKIAPAIKQLSIDDIAHQIHNKINVERTARGLEPLGWDDRLAQVALGHSNDMMKNNYFDHNDLQGNDPSTRFSCYNPRENIAWTEGYPMDQVPQKMMSDWMGSSTHRDNILSGDTSEGIGVSISGSHVIATDDFC